MMADWLDEANPCELCPAANGHYTAFFGLCDFGHARVGTDHILQWEKAKALYRYMDASRPSNEKPAKHMLGR